MNNERRRLLHDALREVAPEGAQCPKPCEFCDTTIDEEIDTMTDKDPGYTQDQLDALVAKAVKDAVEPLQAQLDAAQGEKAMDTLAEAINQAVADAVEPLTTKVADLDKAAEDAAIAQKAAEDERDALKQWLETEAIKQAANGRKDTRVAEVKDLKIHPDGWWDDEARQRKLADMDDESYADVLTEYKAQAALKPKGNGKLPEGGQRSALTDTVDAGAGDKPSAVRQMLASVVPGAMPTAADN